MHCLKGTSKAILPILSMVIVLSACSRDPAPRVVSPSVIHQAILESEAPLLLVHVWATWCQPCKEEFPELVRIIRRYQPDGLDVLLISADDPDELPAVADFLRNHNAPVNSVVTDRLDQDFIESVSPSWEGALPASFFYADGELLAGWEGKRDYEHYAAVIEQLLY